MRYSIHRSPHEHVLATMSWPSGLAYERSGCVATQASATEGPESLVCWQMDCCNQKLVSGQGLAPCTCTTKACRNGRCQMLVTDTHIDRKICPKHLRGGPGTISGVPVRYCQRVRALFALSGACRLCSCCMPL